VISRVIPDIREDAHEFALSFHVLFKNEDQFGEAARHRIRRSYKIAAMLSLEPGLEYPSPGSRFEVGVRDYHLAAKKSMVQGFGW
jgi:hypothetical protein